MKQWDAEVDGENTFDILYQSCFSPTIHIPKVHYSDEGKPVYPTKPCEVPTFVGSDREPLRVVLSKPNVIALSATITDAQLDFVKHCGGDFETHRIIGGEKVEAITLLTTPCDLSARSLERLPEAFIVEPTNAAADRLMTELSPIMPPGSVIKADSTNRGHFQSNSLTRAEATETHLITYAWGNLSRGYNFKERRLARISAPIFKPTSAYTARTKDGLELQQFEERTNCIVQAAGRILRGEGHKIVVVDNIQSELECDVIRDALAGCSSKPIRVINHSLTYQHMEEFIEDIIKCYHDETAVIESGLERLKLKAKKLKKKTTTQTRWKQGMNWQRLVKRLPVDEQNELLALSHKSGSLSLAELKKNLATHEELDNWELLLAMGIKTKQQFVNAFRIQSNRNPSARTRMAKDLFEKIKYWL